MKVTATSRREPGFWRGGVYWSATGSTHELDDKSAEAVMAERMLVVTSIGDEKPTKPQPQQQPQSAKR